MYKKSTLVLNFTMLLTLITIYLTASTLTFNNKQDNPIQEDKSNNQLIVSTNEFEVPAVVTVSSIHSKKKLHKKLTPKENIITSVESKFPNDCSQASRIFNLVKICKSLNGFILNPQEIFSFEKIYELSHFEGYFKPADGILNRQIVKVYAGGICQVSTALLNAVKKANLQVVERHNHSKKMFYSDIGQDAMFNYKTADFKFKNTTSFPIKIQAFVEYDKIKIKLIKLVS